MEADSIAPQMRETNQVFEEIIGSGDFTRLERVYTKNARILPPGAEMACGREHIEVFWQRSASSMGAKSVKLHTIDFELKGDAIFEIGQAEIVTAGGSSQARYVVIWKQENGFWKWHVDIWNSAA